MRQSPRRLREDTWSVARSWVYELCVGAERVVTQVWGQFSVEPELQLLSCSDRTEKRWSDAAQIRTDTRLPRDIYLSFRSTGSLRSETLLWLLHWPGIPL